MGLFSKKGNIGGTPDFLRGFIDSHSHILPGVDDGVKRMEDSLRILGRYEEAGVEEVWCTPHVMEDVPNTTGALKARFEDLKAAYDGPIVLHLAAEYMMDHLFDLRLDADDILCHGDGEKAVLVETSAYNPPMQFDATLDQILSKGYFPILAHPERYYYMGFREYEQLHEKGIRFQMNLGSMADVYGRDVRKKAEWLMDHGLYSYAGSDLHSSHMLDMIMEGKVFKKLW